MHTWIYSYSFNYLGQEIPLAADDGKIKIMEEFVEQDQEVQGDVRTAKLRKR